MRLVRWIAVLILTIGLGQTCALPVLAGDPQSQSNSNDDLKPETQVLQPQTVAYVRGLGIWDDAEQKLGDAFTAIYAALGRDNIRTVGLPLVEYLDSSDEAFEFMAMVPIETRPAGPLSNLVRIGEGPSGKALKFVHRGSLDDLEGVYNRIDDYLAARSLTMKRVVERYQSSRTHEIGITDIYVFVD